MQNQGAFLKELGKGVTGTVLVLHGNEKGRSRSMYLTWEDFPIYMVSVYGGVS